MNQRYIPFDDGKQGANMIILKSLNLNWPHFKINQYELLYGQEGAYIGDVILCTNRPMVA